MNNENNKIIAEFMGAKITDIEGLQNPIYYPIMGKSVYANKLKFHSDWNWLIEVVEKIESLQFNCDILTDSCMIHNSLGNEEFETLGKNKIETVYNACIDFIKWYNEQQK